VLVLEGQGKSWTEPRFIASIADGAKVEGLTIRKGPGKSLHVAFAGGGRGGAVDLSFKEQDLRKLATADDLAHAPPGRFVLTSVPPDNKDANLLADRLCIGGDLLFRTEQPPHGYKVAQDVGMLVHESVEGQVVHVARSPSGRSTNLARSSRLAAITF
jgi:hypothetical protein